MAKEPWFHPLGLTVSQMRLIRDCMWAWTQVPNGHYLPNPRWAKQARDLIKRGYLTESTNRVSPPAEDWIVVLITRENAEKYNADLTQACIEQGLPLPEKQEERNAPEGQGTAAPDGEGNA